MKLSIKGWALASGILCALNVGWIIAIAMRGKSFIAFDALNQISFNLVTPTAGGLILGMIMAFINAAIAGAIFAWLYNLFSK